MRQTRFAHLRRKIETKEVPVWSERFGWACVVSFSEMWSRLPVESNEMIVKQLVERHFKCADCWQYTKEVDNLALCKYCYQKRKEEWENSITDRPGAAFDSWAAINVD
jgi:hypothetical protein